MQVAEMLERIERLRATMLLLRDRVLGVQAAKVFTHVPYHVIYTTVSVQEDPSEETISAASRSQGRRWACPWWRRRKHWAKCVEWKR